MELAYDLISEVFLSTPSARRATDRGGNFVSFWAISIHALREEGDRIEAAPLKA